MQKWVYYFLVLMGICFLFPILAYLVKKISAKHPDVGELLGMIIRFCKVNGFLLIIGLLIMGIFPQFRIEEGWEVWIGAYFYGVLVIFVSVILVGSFKLVTKLGPRCRKCGSNDVDEFFDKNKATKGSET